MTQRQMCAELGVSSVSYWLKRHRLRANGSARFAAKGGLDRIVLASLVAKGLSVPMIAERLSCSPALVGRSLARHRLKTALAPTDPGPGRHSNAVTEL